jgi:hypothetical protein
MVTESKTKRTKVAGRVKGTPNKSSATVKDNILAVFNRLEGTAGMAKWAQANQTEFYKLYAKLLPTQAEHTGADGAPLFPSVINIVGA